MGQCEIDPGVLSNLRDVKVVLALAVHVDGTRNGGSRYMRFRNYAQYSLTNRLGELSFCMGCMVTQDVEKHDNADRLH